MNFRISLLESVGKFTASLCFTLLHSASLFFTTCGEGFSEVPECLVEAIEPPGELGCWRASFYPVKPTTPWPSYTPLFNLLSHMTKGLQMVQKSCSQTLPQRTLDMRISAHFKPLLKRQSFKVWQPKMIPEVWNLQKSGLKFILRCFPKMLVMVLPDHL